LTTPAASQHCYAVHARLGDHPGDRRTAQTFTLGARRQLPGIDFMFLLLFEESIFFLYVSIFVCYMCACFATALRAVIIAACGRRVPCKSFRAIPQPLLLPYLFKSFFFFALALSCVGWSFEVVKFDKGKVDGQWLQNRQPVLAVVVGLYKRAVTTDN
jgi:hypothetical protein